VEETPCRAYDGSVERLVSDLSGHGLYGALLGVGAREFAGGAALSAVGQEFWNPGHGRRRCGPDNLFSSNAFPISPKVRLSLSLLATTTIGFFAEFRNEGKFYFKQHVRRIAAEP
jgi:hypothetical protein